METVTTGQFNRIALDPARSVVVEACAGSGKTWLLVSRIFRLLLAGTAPAEILAITFTHKAAGEMRARLDDWLRYCAGASDTEVREFLRERAIPDAELDDNLSAARGLFEKVLTAQPGLNIYTFHAWFFDILRRAPLETGLAGHTLSEQTELLRQRAWMQFTRQLAQLADGPLAMAMQALLAETGLSNTRKLLQNFVYRRAEWWAYTEGQADPVRYAIEHLRAQIDTDVDRDIAAHLLDDPDFTAALLDYARGLAASTPARQNKSREILAVLDAELVPALRLEQLIDLILTQKGEINATFVPGKTTQSQTLYTTHLRIGEYLLSARKQLQSQNSFRYNERGLRLGAALLQHYQAVKHEARVLDFADIEWQAARLLTHPGHAEYIQFKLDARYSHILLDEFQDTNPVQWRILQSWFEAAHQSRTLPKIFLVGDPKQSIYRFRGAQAGLFKLASDYLTERGASYLAQNCTRRNAGAIIGAINTVFAHNANPLFQPHSGYDSERPGRIEVLPLAQAVEPENGNANRPTMRNPLLEPRPLDKPGNDRNEEAQLLARRIREIISGWAIDDGKGGKRRPQYSDIMILVRSRTHLQTYETALKATQIPYISNRRGGLLDSMEIGDVLSLLQFLGNSHSDLALARVLRSPLFSCADVELMALRSAQTQALPRPAWWPTLLALPQPTQALQRAIDLLRSWISLAARVPVHDLVDRIYFEANVLARYRAAVPAALQNSVVANLTAFMELTLTLGGGRYPSLHRFLTDIATLRRDAEENPDEGELQESGNAVRIFTVHGAKGLEAPIVWLLDTGPHKPKSDSYRILFEWKAGSYRPTHFSLLSTQEKAAEFQLNYLEREAVYAAQENLNLLYVAMTRSRQALLVSGVAGTGSHNWHQMILSALAPDCSEFALGDDLRADCADRIDDHATATVDLSLPADIAQPRNIGIRNSVPDSSASDFGTLVHKLLELMIPPAAIDDEVELRARSGNHPRFDAALDLGRSIAAQDHLQRFFDPVLYLRAYNELAYLRNNGATYRIDRVVEFEREVWLLDYKTGYSGDTGQLTAEHRAQLLEYHSAMHICYPGKTVFCALIDRAGKLIVIPTENSG